jgi:hypothetical protein
MRKRDATFWCATGIFALSIIIFAVTGEQLWLALMIAAYLLRPTLAALGMRRTHVDERELSIQYRSGNLAFAVMLGACVVFSAVLGAKDDHAFEMFNSVIIIGVATKALLNVLLARDPRIAAATIIMAVGLMVALFGSLSHGLSLEGLAEAMPGLAIALIGYLARKFPRVIGAVMLVATVVIVYFVLHNRVNWGQLTTAALIGLPLGLSAVMLIAGSRHADERDSDGALPSVR